MVCVLINAASCELLSALGCARKHAFNSKLHCKIALFLHESAVFNLFKVADVTCVVLIKLLCELIACKNSFVCVDDYNKIAAVNAGCKECFVLASEKRCRFCRNSAERLPAASITYHLRSISSAFGINVDIILSSKSNYCFSTCCIIIAQAAK